MSRKTARVLVCGGLPQSLVLFRGPLIREMRDRGVEVVACANGNDPDTSATLESWGVRYVSLPLSRAGFNPFADLRYLYRLCRLMREVRPDAILGYTHKPVIFSAIAGRICRVPICCGWITGLGYAFIGANGLKQRIALKVLCGLYRFSLRFNSAVIFQNPDDLREFEARDLLPDGIPKAITRGSGIDLAEYPAKPIPSGPPRVLLIARLLIDKGIREFAEAMQIVKKTHPHVAADLVGPFDPNPASIQPSEVQKWVDSNLLHYHGAVADVRPFLEDCALYVLPSYREGTPRTILEAMATGRAVVSTDVPGCRETIENGFNGLLVEPYDARELAAAIVELAKAPALLSQMGQKGRQLAESTFDVKSVNRVVLATIGVNEGD